MDPEDSNDDLFNHIPSFDTAAFDEQNTAPLATQLPNNDGHGQTESPVSEHMAQIRGLTASMNLLGELEPDAFPLDYEDVVGENEADDWPETATLSASISHLGRAILPSKKGVVTRVGRFFRQLTPYSSGAEYTTCHMALAYQGTPFHEDSNLQLHHVDSSTQASNSLLSAPSDLGPHRSPYRSRTSGIEQLNPVSRSIDTLGGRQSQMSERTPDKAQTREKLTAALIDSLREEPDQPKNSGLDHQELQRILNSFGQWKTIKALRRKFYSRHSDFLLLASLGSDKLSQFARRCCRPKELLDEGLITYRDILDNQPPTTLRGVFAFVSLSYAIDAVMSDQKVDHSFSPKIADFGLWRNSILDEEDKVIFDQITSLMWLPETECPVPDESSLPSKPGPQGQSMHVAVDGIFQSMESHPDFQFSIFDPYSTLDSTSWISQQTELDGMQSTPDPFFVGLNCSPPDVPDLFQWLNSEPILNLENLIPPTVPQEYLPPPVSPPLNRRPGGSILAGLLFTTIFFQLVRAFVLATCAPNTLIHHFSGGDEHHQPVFKGRSAAEFTLFSRFVEDARSHILNPLLQRYHSSQPINIALTACSALLLSGWICSIRGIEHYVTVVAKSLTYFLSADVATFTGFIGDLLHYCFKTASVVEAEFHCSRSDEDVQMCDTIYMNNRPTREEWSDPFFQPLSGEDVFACATVKPLRPSGDVLVDEITQSKTGHFEDASDPINCPRTLTPATALVTPASRTSSHDPTTQPLFRICSVHGCNKQYNGPDARTNLRRHEREKHGAGASFVCPFDQCNYTTPRRGNLKKHWERRHKGLEMPQIFRLHTTSTV